MCNALIQPMYDYGSNFWFRVLNINIKCKLQTAQNKVIRFILETGNRHHISTSDFKKVKWLSVRKRVDFRTLCNMYKVYYKLAPTYLCNTGFICDNHSHVTRYSNMSFTVPPVKSNGKISFQYSGIKLWNNLPVSIRSSDTFSKFKKACKSHLIQCMQTDEASSFVTD